MKTNPVRQRAGMTFGAVLATLAGVMSGGRAAAAVGVAQDVQPIVAASFRRASCPPDVWGTSRACAKMVAKNRRKGWVRA